MKVYIAYEYTDTSETPIKGVCATLDGAKLLLGDVSYWRADVKFGVPTWNARDFAKHDAGYIEERELIQ